MILIKCPYCGYRDQSEFTSGGEAHVVRPKNPQSLSDKDWGEYAVSYTHLTLPTNREV